MSEDRLTQPEVMEILSWLRYVETFGGDRNDPAIFNSAVEKLEKIGDIDPSTGWPRVHPGEKCSRCGVNPPWPGGEGLCYGCVSSSWHQESPPC